MKIFIILSLQLIANLANADTIWCSLASPGKIEQRIVLTATDELLYEELENGEVYSTTTKSSASMA